MAEYIDREALLNRLETLVKRITPIEENRDVFFHDSGVDAAITWAQLEVKKAPAADVVEVVRCKDCKWFGRDLGYGKHDCKKYEMPYCLETDFCSYGERRASDDN